MVLDLGSGGGLDCFLAARQIGPEGRAISVDMTPDMVSSAALVSDVEAMLRATGFDKVAVTVNEASREFIKDWFPGSGVEAYVVSAEISAVKLEVYKA